MENKIDQKIYDNTKPIEWTIEELKKRVRNADVINNYYQKDHHAFDFTDTEIERLKDGNREEKWRKCKNYKYYDYDVEASDFGRIKVDGKICELCEEIAPETKIDHKLFNSLIKQGKKHIGYLKARIPENKKCLGPYVYQMVADAWLEDYAYNKTNKQIHHITNDGYDNSPENLIVLDDSTHSMIPKNGEKDDLDYHPRRIIIS